MLPLFKEDVMASHKDLTGTDLHEPKGISTASSGEVYIADGAGSGSYGVLDASSLFPVTDTFWDDLRFPATAINPPGGVNDADIDTNDGTFLFSATATEVIVTVAQMPHAWKEASSVYPHVHWCKTSSASGDVVWQLRYRLYRIGETGTTTWTTLGTVSTPVAETVDADTAEQHLISTYGELSMTGNGLSDILIFEVSRLGTDGADTYGADARLMEFDLHYEIDSLGSDDEFTK